MQAYRPEFKYPGPTQKLLVAANSTDLQNQLEVNHWDSLDRMNIQNRYSKLSERIFLKKIRLTIMTTELKFSWLIAS